MSVSKSIAAVIVTFNRSGKLSTVIDAVCAQSRKPDVIYVIDNASTDDTAEVIATKSDKSVIHVLLPKNIGGAGGFYEGIKLAYEDGHDYLWISDDDAYPEPDAIENLVDELEIFEENNEWKPAFACSRVEWTDRTICEMNIPLPVWDWPRWQTTEHPVILVKSCSFVSVLVPRWAVAQHGLPLKDYFIWHDDSEYTQRLARSYPGLYCPNSVVIHDTPENKGVNYGLVTDASLWKFKYGARNETSRRKRDQGLFGVASFLYNTRSQMHAGGVTGRLRRKIYVAIWRGLFFRPQIEMVTPDY